MPRPAGHWINREAWDDVLRLSGRSLTDIAQAAGVPRPTLSCVVAGHDRASAPLAHRIAKAADVRPATLFPSLRAEAA